MEWGENGLDRISLIAKRDIERRLDVQKRKDDKDQLSAENEKLGFFETTFMAQQAAIKAALDKSPELEKRALPEHFNAIAKDILSLQKYVANSNIFLRTYDLKKCQEVLQELSNQAKLLEEELLPKKKFGFKNRKQQPTQPEPKPVPVTDEVDCAREIPIIHALPSLCGFSKRTNDTLEMSPDEIYKKDVSADYLENCTLKLPGSPSTLHLTHLKNCMIFTGPVSTSIFADNCHNCTLVIACQQLRLHSSTNVHIYLHVTSRAIMEDCSEIYLAPYNWTYDGLEMDFEKSGLDIETNHWTSVDDFNWLSLEKQSPNWSVLSEDVRVKSWDSV